MLGCWDGLCKSVSVCLFSQICLLTPSLSAFSVLLETAGVFGGRVVAEGREGGGRGRKGEGRRERERERERERDSSVCVSEHA